MNRYDKTQRILKDIYVLKNKNYGDSFTESIKEWGIVAAVVRMDDKMRRLRQLVKNGGECGDESIKDTVLDMANYATMLAAYMDDSNIDEMEAEK